MSVSWKTKYLDIRAKLKEATDVSFRLGYERGMKDGTQAAAMQQMQQQAQMQQAMVQGGQPGQPGADQGGMPPGADQGGEMPPGADQGGMPPGGDEDQMEGGGVPPPEEMGDAQGGSELDSHINELQGLVQKGEKPSVLDIRKAVQALAGIRKNQKSAWQKKAEKIIPAQKKIVDGLLKKWEEEAKKPSEKLEDIIKQHGLTVED
jgi:hypothetical protein